MRFSRRAFCQSSSAAVALAWLPGTPALGQDKAARSIPSKVRAVKLNRTETSIQAAA